MNLGLHNKTEGKYRAKKKNAAMGIPSLDLSTLKNVKEFKDWNTHSFSMIWALVEVLQYMDTTI